jgi:hypothetical protein
LSLRAPIAVPVEIRAPARRVFRLALNVGEDGVRLDGTAPFEPGRPVDVRLRLPAGADAPADAAEVLVLRAEVRGEGDEEEARELAFLDPPASTRAALRRYVHQRLGLPA